MPHWVKHGNLSCCLVTGLMTKTHLFYKEG